MFKQVHFWFGLLLVAKFGKVEESKCLESITLKLIEFLPDFLIPISLQPNVMDLL